jgi:Leucine-rich repeat (LRR) protein
LVIAGNKISDIDESFCYESGWMNGLVGLYGCDAFACPKGSYNIYGRQISDAGLCIPCPYLSSATSYGSTTCSPDGKNYSEKEILELFYSSTSGAKWTKSTNWKSVNMSICQWYGVTCDPNDNVIALKLPSNNLIGTVTPYIFGLKFLVTLNLSDNKIELPLVGIGSAVSLEQLYIDRTLTSSLMGIDQAQSLKIFHCQSNNFFGTRIPVGLFDLQSLEILQLADSHFGGSLPSQIGKLVNLKELWW